MPIRLNVIPWSVTITHIRYMILQSLTWVEVLTKHKNLLSKELTLFLMSTTFMQI